MDGGHHLQRADPHLYTHCNVGPEAAEAGNDAASLVAAGWTKLPDQLTAGQETTGWMVFKVDPKNAPTMRLEYTRPTLKVLDTNKTLAKKVYPLPLVG